MAILAAEERPGVVSTAASLQTFIDRYADIVLFDRSFEAGLDDLETDIVVVFGGDGSILRAARQMAYRQHPVVGVNLGRLGFLADLQPDEFREVFPGICAGEYQVIEHLMFEASLQRGGRTIERRLGLNETSILAGAPFTMIDIDLFVDEELATTYRCDGLIVSTPVGSTAHNLSAGGPILRKNLEAFVVSPISPHTLTNRPVVDSADRVYELGVREHEAETSAVVDGRVLAPLRAGDRVRIERAAPTFKLIEVEGRGYYRTLREKLGWGGDLPASRSIRDRG